MNRPAVGALEVIEEAEPSHPEEDDESDYVAGGGFEHEEGRRRGRLEELKKMKKFKLYVVVPRLEALEKGWRVLNFRWVDKERPEVWCCRFVVKDFRALQPWRRDLFTPSSLPITNRIVDAVAESHGWARLVAEATNAFFHAAEDEKRFVENVPQSSRISWQLKVRTPMSSSSLLRECKDVVMDLKGSATL